MIRIDSEIYNKYYPILQKYIKQNKISDEDYISFLNAKFCEVVNRYYNSSDIQASLPVYLRSALKQSKKEYLKIKTKWAREIPVDPAAMEEEVEILENKADTQLNRKLKVQGEIVNQAMLEQVWIKEVGEVDLHSDLLQGLDYREICFLLLSLNSVIYERIAKDFKCSLVTVKRVIASASEKVKINAQKMGYQV